MAEHIHELIERLKKVRSIGSMMDYRVSPSDLQALLKHIDELRAELSVLRETTQAIADGEGDPQIMCRQALELQPCPSK